MNAVNYKVKSPILLLSFNRLDTLMEVFLEIKKVKPSRLYLASDGPRVGKMDANGTLESTKVARVREFLCKSISWECEVHTLFNEQNLGCKYAVSSAISWFFENEESGIILEDDCLPNTSFFRFCDECLEMYKNNNEIFMVSGWSALDFDKKAKQSIKEDYYFSKYNHIWGWASWRRAWKKYELECENLEDIIKNIHFDTRREKREYTNIFKQYFSGNINTWDYPWTFSIWRHNGLCIYPKNNMIKNIGFNRDDATHTTGESKYQDMRIYSLIFPLKHPKKISRNVDLDKKNYKIIGIPSLYLRIFNKILRYAIMLFSISKNNVRK